MAAAARPVSQSALRMRKLRAARRAGVECVISLPVSEAMAWKLVEAGFLRPELADSPAAICAAVIALHESLELTRM